MQNQKYLLALNAHPKIGAQTLKKIINHIPNLEKLWAGEFSIYQKELGEKTVDLIREVVNNIDPEKEIEKLIKYDVGFITIFDKDYPEKLKEMPDCPAILYVKGNKELLNKPSLGIVGSRKYSSYGKNVCEKFSRVLSESGLVVVSGMALGIDGLAHRAVLEADGDTIGVLGCGLDRIYPVSNYQIGKAIIDSGGAIISEYPLGTPPMKQNFPARNRIIAGLSLGVLVVEASLDSGSLITAMCALEYNREVFAVPGNIDEENTQGTNKLIQEGAKLVISPDDILNELNIGQKSKEESAKKILPETEDEKTIFNLLRDTEMSADQISAETAMSIISINTTLTFMEMKGMVRNIGGGRWKRVK